MQTTNLHTVKHKSTAAKWKSASLLLLSATVMSSALALDNSITDSPTIIASKGVSGINLSIQSTDNDMVKLHDFNDLVIVDLGRIVLKGETYFIDWKKAQHSSSESVAHLSIRESISNTNFIKNSVVHTTASKKLIKSTFIAESDIRFILISTASPLDDSIDIDKISLDYVQESSPEKSTSKSLSTENHKPGSSLEKENSSLCHYSFVRENDLLREKQEKVDLDVSELQRKTDFFINQTSSVFPVLKKQMAIKKEAREIRPPPI